VEDVAVPERGWRTIIILFVACSAGLALFSWDRVIGPSPHFHFLDLAHSFLDGRLDTETPTRHRGLQQRDTDPRGFQDAVNRHLTGGNGKTQGWNDWATLRIITLTDDTVVKGAFPWSDQQGDAKKRFRTVDKAEMIIDRSLDIKRGCTNPGGRCDERKHFVSFPPFPAVAMMPLYLLFGYDTNDVLFTVINAALNAVLLFMMLELLRTRGLSTRPTRENLLLAVLFTFGTVNLFSSIRGEVWFTALILGITLHILYVMMAIGARRPLLAGLMLALGMATRTPIAFACVFFALEMFREGDRMRWPGWGTVLKKGALFSAPVLAVGFALMAYNHARFDNAFEFGHTYLANGTRASIRDHGLFSFWFFKNNLAAALTNPPVIDGFRPFIHITRHGLGLFWCTPALLFVLWPKKWSAFARNVAVTAVIVAIPSLFYQNTGWAQFGYRFALDYMPYLFVLLAVCARPFNRLFQAAVIVSLLFGILGAVTFDRIPMFYYD